MNPIFTCHLIADFLLQPNILVKWKNSSIFGIIIHAGIHFLVMSLLLLPSANNKIALILLIAVSHGIIDIVAIKYKKKGIRFELVFLIDQAIHLLILYSIANNFVPSDFWLSTKGILASIILISGSFLAAFWNLAQHKKTIRLLSIIAVFSFYLLCAFKA